MDGNMKKTVVENDTVFRAYTVVENELILLTSFSTFEPQTFAQTNMMH